MHINYQVKSLTSKHMNWNQKLNNCKYKKNRWKKGFFKLKMKISSNRNRFLNCNKNKEKTNKN